MPPELGEFLLHILIGRLIVILTGCMSLFCSFLDVKMIPIGAVHFFIQLESLPLEWFPLICD